MAKKTKNLSHEEIWDDSALVDSWNEAYEEYKYYHGLHARGEKVKDVLDAYERGENASASRSKADGNGVKAAEEAAIEGPPSEDGEIGEEDGVEMETEGKNTAQEENLKNEVPVDGEDNGVDRGVSNGGDNVPVPTAAAAVAATAAFPEGFPTPQDPALKSLMMSWYWAGYYTGLYEGQKKSEGG